MQSSYYAAKNNVTYFSYYYKSLILSNNFQIAIPLLRNKSVRDLQHWYCRILYVVSKNCKIPPKNGDVGFSNKRKSIAPISSCDKNLVKVQNKAIISSDFFLEMVDF